MSSLKTIELYELLTYDGAEGTMNFKSGFITESKSLATRWNDRVNGNTYNTITGVLVSSEDEFEEASLNLKKLKALRKLTAEERKLLGLE